jgi:hypothetical protein
MIPLFIAPVRLQQRLRHSGRQAKVSINLERRMGIEQVVIEPRLLLQAGVLKERAWTE